MELTTSMTHFHYILELLKYFHFRIGASTIYLNVGHYYCQILTFIGKGVTCTFHATFHEAVDSVYET